MKELYIAPEAKLIGFAAAENLANGEIDLDELLGGDGLVFDPTGNSTGEDVDLGTGLNITLP